MPVRGLKLPPMPAPKVTLHPADEEEAAQLLADIANDSRSIAAIEESRARRVVRLGAMGISLRAIARAFDAGTPSGATKTSPTTIAKIMQQS